MQVERSPQNLKMEPIKIFPEASLPTKITQSIKRIVEKVGLMNYTIDKRCISTNGGNYLGDLYEVDVKGKTGTGEKELNIFVKKIVENEESIKIIDLKQAYKTELFIYKELSKIFEKLQLDAGIPAEEQYKMVKIYNDTDTDLVIMENIAKKGFKTYHRTDIVSLKFLELCLKNIAKFHGLSFVLKEKYPEYFDEKLKTLNHPYILGKDFKQIFKSVKEITIKYVDEDLKEKVKNLYNDLVDNLNTYINDETIKTCLCHGDYRPNNIMMREEEGDIKEVISIDYQLNHYGCPVFDILYLIYICTDREFRKSHMFNLKNIYYDTLQSFLKYFDLEADVVYPRKEYERVFKEKIEYGLLVAFQMLPFMFVLDEDVPDISQQSKNTYHFQIDDRFKERIQGVIEEFIELGSL